MQKSLKKYKKLVLQKISLELKATHFLIITEDVIIQNNIIDELQLSFPFIYSNNNYKFNVKTHIHFSKTLYDFENTNEAIAIIKECSNQTKKSVSNSF